ncbi:MAG: hypothetical protein PVI01_04510 [Gemmatimonadales bacterium]
MLGRQTSSKTGALALALPGDRVDIGQILFDAVRGWRRPGPARSRKQTRARRL